MNSAKRGDFFPAILIITIIAVFGNFSNKIYSSLHQDFTVWSLFLHAEICSAYSGQFVLMVWGL